MRTLNIQVFVDVVGLLSGAPMAKAVHMFDDGGLGSEGQGTHALATAVLPGQLVRWTVNPIDVQTQVWIKDIVFGPVPAAETAVAPTPATEAPAEAQADTDAPVDAAVAAETDTAAQAPAAPAPAKVPVWGKRFEGYVPFAILPDLPHVYRIELAFASGSGPTVTVQGPALRFVIPHVAPLADSATPQLL